ncbi:MAG: hypothetical protein R3338_11580, partial [Thermoanaerobaculia bacterium]|nr:hypothetical protein [Thermoanaerobaculia bacterium]
MKHHLDREELLEILYLDEPSRECEEHLVSCALCHDQLTELRSEVESDRLALSSRVEAKPERFWSEQREEIVTRAITSNVGAFSLLRHRLGISIAMAILLVALGMFMIRTAREEIVAPAPVETVETAAPSELFEDDEVRELDPWETDELESFHQIVEWEEWIDEDVDAAPEEE